MSFERLIFLRGLAHAMTCAAFREYEKREGKWMQSYAEDVEYEEITEPINLIDYESTKELVE